MRVSIIILIIILTCTFCKKEQVKKEHQAGKFLLTKSGNLYSDVLNSDTIELGEIKISKEYYFSLLNIGESVIFDIDISTDNPNFEISPTKIKKLSNERDLSSDECNQIFPIISLSIEHGNKLDAYGYGKLLKKGINKSIITITGKTVQGSDTINISANYPLIVNAKIMDIRIYSDGKEINLFKPDGSLTTPINGIGTIPYYHAHLSNIKIANTGNTPINIEILSNDTKNYNLALNDSIDSLKVSTMEIDLTEGHLNTMHKYAVFKISSNGVAVNNDKLHLLPDGNAYFSLEYY